MVFGVDVDSKLVNSFPGLSPSILSPEPDTEMEFVILLPLAVLPDEDDDGKEGEREETEVALEQKSPGHFESLLLFKPVWKFILLLTLLLLLLNVAVFVFAVVDDGDDRSSVDVVISPNGFE